MADTDWRGVAEECRRLASPAVRDGSRRFLLEGYRLHERAVRAGAELDTVLVAESLPGGRNDRARLLLRDLACSRARVVRAPDPVLEELTGGRGNGPLVGIARMEVPAGPALPGRSGVILVAADVEDPGNVGAMIRTALAAGCAGFAAAGISDPYHPKSVRTSMGSLFRVPVRRYVGGAEAAQALKAEGIRCIGAASREGVPLPEAGLSPARPGVALFMGGESLGLSEPVARVMDATVTIPMADRVDSFSVNAAAAIILYEIFRGQQPKPGFQGQESSRSCP